MKRFTFLWPGKWCVMAVGVSGSLRLPVCVGGGVLAGERVYGHVACGAVVDAVDVPVISGAFQ